MQWGRCGIVAGLVLSFAGVAGAQQGTPDKTFSKLNTFRIPFQITPGEQANLREIQLYSSDDWGLKWKPYATATPDKSSFVFRTEQDGEFWFTVRTLDREGHLYPEDLSRAQPGLKVVVDTHPPTLQLRPLPRKGPEVSVQWEARDDNLVPDSLRIEYQMESDPSWQPVSPPAQPNPQGTATWKVSGPGKVMVRGRVKDRAGNEATAQAEIPPASLNDQGPLAASPATMPAEGNRPAPSPSRPKLPTTDTASKPDAGSMVTPASASAPSFQSAEASELKLKSSEPADHGLNETGLKENSAPDLLETNRPAPPPKPMFVVDEPKSTAATPEAEKTVSGDRDAPIASPPEQHRPASAPEPGDVPQGTRFIKSTRLSLQYHIDSVGPSGATVEVWTTEDRGQTWQRVALHQDLKAPITLDLKHEGLVGLSMVARSGAGLGEKPPITGDQPQMWVMVDTTPPQAQIKPPRLLQSSEPPTVLLSWSASDRNLGNRPINLFYSDRPDGHWETIATGIENTGSYEWKMPSTVAYRFYLRLEVVDRARNRALIETPEPVLMDDARPKSHIVSIDPIKEKDQKAE